MRPPRSVSRPILVLGIAAALGILGSSAGCKKEAPPPPPPPPTPTPVIPPGSVVFVQRGHLVRMDLANSQTVPLTSGKSSEWFPACSPDGKEVAYWSNAESGVYNLWKMNVDGSGERTRLTYDPEDALRTGDLNLLINSAPAWSKDGKRLLYAAAGDLWIMDSDGFNPESLLLGHSVLCPFFSPDEKTVYFVTNREDTVHNLWSMTLADHSLKRITQYKDWNVGSPSFLPDGSRILYNLYRANMTQIYTMAPDGSGPANLTTDNRSLCPRSAILGRSLVYCAFETQEAGDLINVFLAKANGTESKALTTEGGTSPTWAPQRILPASDLPTPVGGKPGKPAATTQELTP